jgi:predicted enzyme related to lactoylglutathione lyase
MKHGANALNWFEICVHDMPRAQHFYENVFAIKMEKMDMPGMEMAGFPVEMGHGHVGGALVKSAFHIPSMDGAIVYLNGNPDLSHMLDRAPHFGGKIIMPKTKISDDIGYMAMFADTEGNRVALHSNK